MQIISRCITALLSGHACPSKNIYHNALLPAGIEIVFGLAVMVIADWAIGCYVLNLRVYVVYFTFHFGGIELVGFGVTFSDSRLFS